MKPTIQKDLNSVSWALNLFRLGNAMAGIFIPLVIFKSGGELWLIAVFYVVYALVKICINFWAMQLIQRKGAHFGLATGFFFGGLQIVSVLIYSLHSNQAFLAIAAVSMALTYAFMWNAQHSFISQVMDHQTKSSSIATIEIIGRVFDIVGPLIGGLIGAIFGATWLLIVAIICMAATVVPLRHMGKLASRQKAQTITYNLSGAPLRDIVANFCVNIEICTGIFLWPIYLAVVLKNYDSIGFVAAIAATASIITTAIAGRRGDDGNDRSVLRQGAIVSCIVNFVRIFTKTPLSVGVVSSIYQSSFAYTMNSWTSTYYAHAKERGVQYIISMEIACDVAYLSFWSVLLVSLLIFDNPTIFFNMAFVMAGVASLGVLFVSRQPQTIKT